MDASAHLKTFSATNFSTRISSLGEDVFDEVDGPTTPQKSKPKPIVQHNRTDLFSAATEANVLPVSVNVKSPLTEQKLRRKTHEKHKPSHGDSSDKSLTYRKDFQECESQVIYRVR